jgi:hypothetical protein
MEQNKVLLSERDSRRVEDAIRRVEARARAIQPFYRRRGRTAPSKGSKIHLAYCKAAAGSGATIECYLDTDWDGITPPTEPTPITVYCKIYEGGTALNACAPLLANGDLMFVFNDGTYWRSLTTFIPTDTCE